MGMGSPEPKADREDTQVANLCYERAPPRLKTHNATASATR